MKKLLHQKYLHTLPKQANNVRNIESHSEKKVKIHVDTGTSSIIFENNVKCTSNWSCPGHLVFEVLAFNLH